MKHPPTKNTFLENLFTNPILPYFFIFLAVGIVYARTLFFEYVAFDDDYLITNTEFIDTFDPIAAFGSDAFYGHNVPYYRPIGTIAYMADALLWGKKAFGYHLTNILIHVINCCLLFVLLKKFGCNDLLSFFFSLLFAVHPLLSQAVAWIAGRADSLLCLFFLSSFISLINFLEAGKKRWLFFHFLLFALGLFNKETAILLPVISVIFIWINGNNKLTKNHFILLAAGWISIILLWFLMRNAAIDSSHMVVDRMSFTELLIGYLSYIGNLLLPFDLSGYPLAQDINWKYGVAVLIILFFLFFYQGIHDKKRFWFGIFWFLALLLPTVLFYLHGYAVFLEHRVYLPAVGFIIMLSEFNFIRKIDFKKSQHWIIGICVLVFFSVKTFIHEKIFSDSITFWSSVIKSSPHLSETYIQLGALYFENKKMEVAEPYFQKALQLTPSAIRAVVNMGSIEFTKGNLKESEKWYRKAIEIEPDNAQSYYNLALIDMSNNSSDSAINKLNRAIYFFPYNKLVSISDFLTHCYNHLGRIYLEKNDNDKAIEYYQKAIESNPKFILGYQRLAELYSKKEDREKANYYLQKAEELQLKLKIK